MPGSTSSAGFYKQTRSQSNDDNLPQSTAMISAPSCEVANPGSRSIVPAPSSEMVNVGHDSSNALARSGDSSDGNSLLEIGDSTSFDDRVHSFGRNQDAMQSLLQSPGG